MTDSDDDDWFNKDLKDFKPPTASSASSGNVNHITGCENIKSYAGHSRGYSNTNKSKSTIPNSDKILETRLKILLSKPDHIVALDLFVKQKRWRNTLIDFCALKNTTGLDLCLDVLDKVVSTPLVEIKGSILLVTASVPEMFTWYIKEQLVNDRQWKYRLIVENLLAVLWKVVITPEVGEDLKWFLEYFSCLKDQNLITVEVNETLVPSILPTIRDFNTTPPKLESIPSKGPINDPNKYLRIQMDLLREELLHDLRSVVTSLRQGNRQPGPLVQLKLNTTFDEVIIIDPPLSAGNYINGTLLILSTSTDFDSLILATVTEFSSRELKVEIISVENVNSSIFDRPLIMEICPAFFEPLYRVHNQLRLMMGQSLPFDNVFLRLDKTLQTRKVQSITPTTTDLYTRQVDAVCAGVTQAVTLIQGPPGTGKSFIGLKILNNLLAKRDMNEERILIVSVTNHALDEVLKALTQTTQKIVRFGTQSKERSLDEFNVKYLDAGPIKSLVSDALTLAKELYSCPFNSEDSHVLETVVEKRNRYARLAQEIKLIETLGKVESKRVLGMTTTAAARLHILLELFKPKVLLVEEAAQILECHTLAALTKSLEQVIFIGDHHQLRANLQVPRLATDHNFDVSLFERLVENGMSVVQLDRQKRMRPELADLLRVIFYSSYEDHSTVLSLPDHVRGVQKNMFFLDHQVNEIASLGRSKMNVFEAQFSLLLADYLLKQGYCASNLVILSFYKAHLDVLNGKLLESEHRHLKDVRTRTVDNFQGEEADIVILNVVRSNEEKSLGHVATKNRICTALTRAKFGLYIIGNASLAKEASMVWSQILARIVARDALGGAFPLKCEQHGNVMLVRNSSDFRSLTNRFGGCTGSLCNMKCDLCGQNCNMECHPLQVRHNCSCK